MNDERTASTSLPVLAVVGRVNKGKSSIIATLTENENVKISQRPGTTTEVVSYTVSLHGRPLFRVVDTPGFEEAARMLHWLTERETNAANRRRNILEFVRAFSDTDEFIEERRLLTPILEGAAILYVVDGTRPYRENYEAEMAILRRTGEPGIALINRIGEGDHTTDWEQALKQYFDLVRHFDAHQATFQERMRLLGDIGTLKQGWRQPLQEAINALKHDRMQRLEEASEAISKMLMDIQTLRLSQATTSERPSAKEKEALEQRFHQRIRTIESNTHQQIDRIYGHTKFREEIEELDIESSSEHDLFAEDTWRAMGLKPQTEIGLYTATGAGLGLAADAAVGGLSGGAGALFGGLTGAGFGAFRVGSRFANAGTAGGLMHMLSGMFNDESAKLTIGPHPSINLPFVILNRAFSRLDLVRNWSHARQEFPGMADTTLGDIRSQLSSQERRNLAKIFAKLRRSAPNPPRTLRENIYEEIFRIIRELIDE